MFSKGLVRNLQGKQGRGIKVVLTRVITFQKVKKLTTQKPTEKTTTFIQLPLLMLDCECRYNSFTSISQQLYCHYLYSSAHKFGISVNKNSVLLLRTFWYFEFNSQQNILSFYYWLCHNDQMSATHKFCTVFRNIIDKKRITS